MIEAFDPSANGENPLNLILQIVQAPTDEPSFPQEPIETVVSRQVFGLSEPPRWVLVASLTQMVLLDRTKWNQKRLFRFDLPEIFGRRDITTLQAMAALLHRDLICPPGRPESLGYPG